jgi:hypothetical protein
MNAKVCHAKTEVAAMIWSIDLNVTALKDTMELFVKKVTISFQYVKVTIRFQ